jgi:predicted nucleic acid-binding protein
VIVLDASAVVEFLANSAADERLVEWIRSSPPLQAPHLLDIEVTNALRRQCALGSMTAERAELALNHFQLLPITRHSHLPHLDRIWELRHNFTAYDAVYLALAEALGTVLLTRDAALAHARLRRGRVEVI